MKSTGTLRDLARSAGTRAGQTWTIHGLDESVTLVRECSTWPVVEEKLQGRVAGCVVPFGISDLMLIPPRQLLRVTDHPKRSHRPRADDATLMKASRRAADPKSGRG
jgi:hypothetical protein